MLSICITIIGAEVSPRLHSVYVMELYQQTMTIMLCAHAYCQNRAPLALTILKGSCHILTCLHVY